MEKIKIGTLVNAKHTSDQYIASILPHGFESFSLTYWQQFHDAPPEAICDKVRKVIDESDAVISSLSVFGNPIENEELDLITRQCWYDTIDRVKDFGTDLVTGFTGRVRGKSVPDSIERFKEVWSPIVEHAQNKGVRIAWENCTMGGNWHSGDWNLAFNPDAWEILFDALDWAENVGLQWEPCHQMTQLIDPMPQIRQWGKRFFNVHGKDATIRHDIIAKHGFGGKEQAVWHRTPGFGDSNWTNIITELRHIGFEGSIDIEGWHDPVYRGDLEMTGQVHALNYLKHCRGGSFIEFNG